MLSIGLFTYSTRPRGSVVHACALAEALTAEGHAVTLYALSKAGDALYRPLSCETVLFPAAPAPSDPDRLIAQRVEEMAAGIASARPRHDVYHAEDCLAASALLASGSSRRPLVRTVHHVEVFESAYLRECQRRSIVQADGVLTVSRLSQEDVRAGFDVRSTIVWNGVDPTRFQRRGAGRSPGLLSLLGSDVHARFVLSLGGVEPRKNTLLALSGMLPLLEQQPELHWLLVGGASIWEHAPYRALFAEELGRVESSIRARIHQLTSVTDEELTTLYQRSDVFLCASLQEGFGLSVLEALAAGTPAVVPSGAPFDEYLDASCATFIDPRDARAITRGVSQLLLDRELSTARRAAGIARAERFSWRRVARAHEAFYRELIERRAHAAARAQRSPDA